MRIVEPIPKNPASKAKFAKNKLFLHCEFTPFIRRSFQIWDPFFPSLFSKDWTLESGGKKTFKRSEQMKKICKKNLFRSGNFTPFMSNSFQIGDHFFSLLFPKYSEDLKSLDIGLLEVGAKRRLNGVRNINTKKNLAQ